MEFQNKTLLQLSKMFRDEFFFAWNSEKKPRAIKAIQTHASYLKCHSNWSAHIELWQTAYDDWSHSIGSWYRSLHWSTFGSCASTWHNGRPPIPAGPRPRQAAGWSAANWSDCAAVRWRLNNRSGTGWGEKLPVVWALLWPFARLQLLLMAEVSFVAALKSAGFVLYVLSSHGIVFY